VCPNILEGQEVSFSLTESKITHVEERRRDEKQVLEEEGKKKHIIKEKSKEE
jgi:hypothetical protein